MDEQRAWIKSKRKKRLRALAAILCLCLLFATYPDILETLSVFATGTRNGDGTVYVAGFARLPEEVRKQTVPVGTGAEELILPDTLEAVVAIPEGEVLPEDAEEEMQTPPEDAEEETGAPPEDEGEETEVPSETAGKETESSEAEGTETEESADDTQPEQEANGENADDNAVDSGESASSVQTGQTEDAEPTQETHTVTMPEYQAENVITVETLENTQETGTKEETVTIEDIIWQSEPEYDGNTEGTYIFTAVLPEGYALMEGISLPQITVTVQEDSADSVIQALFERIAALPDAEEYLAKKPDTEEEEAYAEWMEGLYQYAGGALDIQEAYEALTSKQQAQIPEEAFAKIAAWVELAETAGESVQVMAATDTATSGVCGDTGNENSVTWEYNEGTNTLTISGSGKMASYPTPGTAPWNSYRESIKNVVIGGEVTNIGTYAFYGCNNLPSITIPDKVQGIGFGAFYCCSDLTSVSIPDGVKTIAYNTFVSCRSLTSVSIPNSVTAIGDAAFLGCNSLTSITIPDSVVSINKEAFRNCTSLTEIIIPDGVTKIQDNTFDGCTSLMEVIFEPTTPPTMGTNVFKDCGFVTDNNPVTGIQVPEGSKSAYTDSNGNFKDYAQYIATHKHKPCGAIGSPACGHDGHDEVEYEPFPAVDASGVITLEAGKNYYLTGTVTVSKTITINSTNGGTVNICLNGHTLTGVTGNSTYVIKIVGSSSNHVEVNICDCSENKTGIITADTSNSSGQIIYVENAELNIYGGTVENKGTTSEFAYAVILKSGATLNMYGGKISAHKAIVSNVAEPGINIYDGEVSGTSGSAICAESSSIIKISGGTISSASTNATIINTGGSLTVTGGEIEQKKTGTAYAISNTGNTSSFKMSGGTVTTSGFGIATCGNDDNISGGTIKCNSSGGVAIDNFDTLTITGEKVQVTSQNIAIRNGDSKASNSHLEIKGGNFKSTGGRTLENDAGATATISGGTITNTNIAIDNLGTLTVTEGTISGNLGILNRGGTVEISENSKIEGTSSGIENQSYTSGNPSMTYKGTITIKGGNISTGTGGNAILNGKADGSMDTSLLIQGGTITSASSCTIKNNAGATATISGGTIENTNGTIDNKAIDNSGDLTISGGTFKSTSTGGNITNSDTLKLSGSPTFTNTGIMLNGNATITIPDSSLGFNGTPCTIYVDDSSVTAESPITLTSGWNTYMPNSTPSLYFKSGLDYCTIVVDDTTKELILRPFKVTFDYCDDAASQVTEYVNSDKKVNPFPSAPTRTGYIFKGWYNAETGGTEFTADNKFTTGDTTLYAHWALEPMNVTAKGYTGIYDGNPHSITVTAPDGAAVTYGTAEGSCTLTSNPTYTDAGTYTVYYQVTKENYDTIEGSKTVTISKKSLTITAEEQSVIWNYSIDPAKYKADGMITGDDIAEITLTPSTEALTDNGTISISGVKLVNASGKDVTGNYDIKTVKGTLKVTRDTALAPDRISAVKSTTSYMVGDTLNVNDITVTAYYADGYSEEVTGFTTNVADIDMSEAGEKTLTVSYTKNGENVTADINITVNEKQITVGDWSGVITSGSGGVKIVDYSGSDTTVEVPSVIGGKPVTAIGEGVFADCTGLTTIMIPEGVDTTNAGITDTAAKIIYKVDENGKITITSVTPGTDSDGGKKPVTLPDTIGGQKPEISDTVKAEMKNIPHEHKGGTATCTQKAVCEICGEGHGELAGHTLARTEGVEPTPTEAGNKEYWTCSVCGKLYKDEQGQNETNRNEVTIPATGDGEAWSSVTTSDGVKIVGYSGSDTTVEVPSEIGGKPVTAIGEDAFSGKTGITSVTIPGSVTAIGEGVFSGCTGLTTIMIPESLNTTNAGITDTAAKITYKVDGNGKITITSVTSGKDSSGKEKPVTLPDTIGGQKPEISDTVKETMKNIPHEHKGGTATCTKKAVCEICGKGYGEPAGHDYGGSWQYDESGHWKLCSRCKAKDKHRHHYDNDRDRKCNDCGYKRAIKKSDDEQPAQPTPQPEELIQPTPQPQEPVQPADTPDNKPENEQKPEDKQKPDDTPGQGGTEPAQTEGKASQTVQVSIDSGKLTIAGDFVTTGNTTEASAATTILEAGDGAVIVTVVCEAEEYTVGVSDTVAVANAVLTPEQIWSANDGETIEIRVDVKDISGAVPEQDREIIESGLTEYQKELPELTLGMYIDISLFVKAGANEWDAVTETAEPIEVVVGIPEELKADDRKYYIIRSHDGAYTLLPDRDDNPDTITVSTNLFSAYAIVYEEAADAAGAGKYVLNRISPTHLRICWFVWLAVVAVAAAVVGIVAVVKRRKEEEEEVES